jgi:CRP-like cAMP-binding protein
MLSDGPIGSDQARRLEEARRAVEAYFGGEANREVVGRVLGADMEWTSLAAGETLFRQGEPSDSVYVVAGGRLRVFAETPGEPPRLLNEVGRGELIGEMGAITGEPRRCGRRATPSWCGCRRPASTGCSTRTPPR